MPWSPRSTPRSASTPASRWSSRRAARAVWSAAAIVERLKATRQLMNWEPTGPTLLDDLEAGHYTSTDSVVTSV